jgi:hypothetical protein
LNFAAREIVPNSVQVAIPSDGANAGQIDITFDALGVAGPTTDILIDVLGYTVEIYSEAEIDAKFAELETTVENSQTIMSSATVSDPPDPGDDETIFVTVKIDVPVDGTIQVVGSYQVRMDSLKRGWHVCAVTYGPGELFATVGGAARILQWVDSDYTLGCIVNGAIKVTAGTHVLNLVGRGSSTDLETSNGSLDVIFSPGGNVEADTDPK